MFVCGCYQRTCSIPVGEMLRQCIREEGSTEKEIYLGRLDAKEWSEMLAAKRPLDLLVLAEILPLKVWMRFGPRLLGAIVQRFMEQQKEGAA